MKFDRAALEIALTEIDRVKPSDLPKVLKLVRTLQAQRMLKIHALWPSELEAVARYVESKIRDR